MLSDDKSRNTFSNLLNFKICYDMSLLEEVYEPFERRYFDKQLIKYGEDDVFVDCGSYDGDTIEYYRRWSNGTFSKVYAVEADEANYKLLINKYKRDTRAVPMLAALWDEKMKLKFDNIGSGSGAVSEKGAVEVDADTIDHIVNGGRVDFIKVDIEGAEYQALVGARHTIEIEKPTLMISVYHQKADFIRIPLLIKSLNPNYKIYFRHCRKMSEQETICYAIP